MNQLGKPLDRTAAGTLSPEDMSANTRGALVVGLDQSLTPHTALKATERSTVVIRETHVFTFILCGMTEITERRREPY